MLINILRECHPLFVCKETLFNWLLKNKRSVTAFEDHMLVLGYEDLYIHTTPNELEHTLSHIFRFAGYGLFILPRMNHSMMIDDVLADLVTIMVSKISSEPDISVASMIDHLRLCRTEFIREHFELLGHYATASYYYSRITRDNIDKDKFFELEYDSRVFLDNGLSLITGLE